MFNGSGSELYDLQQRILPQLVFHREGDGELVFHLGAFCVKVLEKMHEGEKGYDPGVTEEDFPLRHVRFKDGDLSVYVTEMGFPQLFPGFSHGFGAPPMCRKVYICMDEDFRNPGYYCWETDSFYPEGMLCGKNAEGAHLNYGSVEKGDPEAVLHQVAGMYIDRIRSLRKGG